MAEDEMVGWHHGLNGHEFEQTLGDGEGWGSLMHCSPWDSKELDTTERQNNKKADTERSIHTLVNLDRTWFYFCINMNLV